MMRIEKSNLVSLLKRTKREAVVGGKKVPQVNSAVIFHPPGQNLVQTTAIVRDGVSSIARFTAPVVEADADDVYVANIDLLLGALSAHSGVVSIKSEKGKLVLKSKSKSTTLVSDPKAKAFPHTNKTVLEWAEDSAERYAKSLGIIPMDEYMMQDGTRIPAKKATVPTKELLDAIRSGSINGQMVEKVRFINNPDLTLEVRVGDEMKGSSSTLITSTLDGWVGETTIGGGFEHILAHCADPECDLLFFDFTKYGAGIAVVLRTSSAVVFQREATNG
jgi:hypothetical protein